MSRLFLFLLLQERGTFRLGVLEFKDFDYGFFGCFLIFFFFNHFSLRLLFIIYLSNNVSIEMICFSVLHLASEKLSISEAVLRREESEEDVERLRRKGRK